MFYGLFNSNTQKKFLIGAVLLIGLLFFGTGTNNTAVGYHQDIIISELPPVLEGYREEGMVSTSDIPVQSPLGGNVLEYTYITSGYCHWRSYKNDWHRAIDIFPTSSYFANSKAYKLMGGDVYVCKKKKPEGECNWGYVYGDIILFAVMDGTVIEARDSHSSGGLTVRIVNDSWTYELGYAHLKTMYVREGDYVIAGTPIGVMGRTGMEDVYKYNKDLYDFMNEKDEKKMWKNGTHLHYWIAPMDCAEGVKCKKACKKAIDHEPELRAGQAVSPHPKLRECHDDKGHGPDYWTCN